MYCFVVVERAGPGQSSVLLYACMKANNNNKKYNNDNNNNNNNNNKLLIVLNPPEFRSVTQINNKLTNIHTCLHSGIDPLMVVDHFGVGSRSSLLPALESPADDALQVPLAVNRVLTH